MPEIFERALEAHQRGDLEEAARGYAQIAQFKNARLNLAIVYRMLGRVEEAERLARSVLESYPDFEPAKQTLSMILLAQEKYAEGWALHEARRMEGGGIWAVNPETPAPEWRGEDIRDRAVVVCAEQGYGDQMMFARYLPFLEERGARAVIACNALMRPLFATRGYAVARFSPGSHQIPHCDTWVLIGSLPHRLGLGAPPLPMQFAIPRGGGGVGVVPTGNPVYFNDANRSLPAEYQAQLLAMGRDLRPEATGARNFQESAKLFAGLDLVITVDTAAAHLAGSIGVPTWVLLPCIGTDWRWLRDRSDSPWYPSVRLFRQPAPGDWESVFREVRAGVPEGGRGR